MATFVLVHGAWQGGWCWTRVSSILRQQGHQVFTPTLTGLGERAHLLTPQTNLETHIEDVLGVIRCEELSDVVLCAHSYGGMVSTGVADRACEKIHSLFYLDALVPADGECVLDVLPAEAAADFRESAETRGDGYRLPPAPAEAFAVNAQDRAWVDRRSTDHPFGSFTQPIHLDGKWKEVPKRTYLYATGWSPGVGKPFFHKAQKEPGWNALTVPCGHDMMIDKPQELAEHLLASLTA